MDASRETAIKLFLAHEGGYVNNPADPGGPTNKGITQAVYDGFRRVGGLKARSVRAITVAEVHEIYSRQYLDPIRYADLPPGLGYAVADYAVNSGVARAVKDLQRTLNARGAGLKVDSILGLATLRAATAADRSGDTEEVIIALCERRLRFMRSLKTWKTFGRGWTRRVMGAQDGAQDGDTGVIDYAIAMAQNADAPPIPRRPGGGARATEASTAVTRTPGGAGTIAATAGMAGTMAREAADQIQGLALDGWVGQVADLAFLGLTVVGVGLLTYSWFKRMQERGAV